MGRTELMSEYTHPLTGMRSCMPPDPNTKRPRFKAPQGSCDSHCHVFGPHEVFPYHSKSTYHPPDGPKETLAALHKTLGIDRAVIVQASCHGPDNRAMMDACLLYTSPSPRDATLSRMPSSA